jgi:hypothetical protein
MVGRRSQETAAGEYPAPTDVRRADGSARWAFATFLMLNDSYLPGALMVGYALRKQRASADRLCLVTPEISSDARDALELLFDHVVEVDRVFVPHARRQERQDRPYWFTRVNALRLGGDGDLGFAYDKVVVLDADLLPLKHYDHLFTLDTPAGILNESKSSVMEVDQDGRYIVPPDVERTGQWVWHRMYGAICPHGHRIPAEITDRVKTDPANMGLNGSLFVLAPSIEEFRDILVDVRRPEIGDLVSNRFEWPDMQYLTMRWSGKWTSIDVRFSGFSGYPVLSVLLGTHYAGFKPWSFKKAKAMARWARHDDFQLWFREYKAMVAAYPELLRAKRLSGLLAQIQELGSEG